MPSPIASRGFASLPICLALIVLGAIEAAAQGRAAIEPVVESATLVVRTLHADSGEPVPGVAVHVLADSPGRSLSPGDPRSRHQERESDERGRAEFVVPPGSWKLWIDGRARGLVSTHRKLEHVRRGSQRTLDVRLAALIAHSGRIVDEDGQAVPGAAVATSATHRAIVDGRGDWARLPRAAARSDTEGRFELRAPSADRHAWVDLPGFAPTPVFLSDEAGDIETVVLLPAASVRGRLVDFLGSPIRAARITLRADMGRLLAPTDADQREAARASVRSWTATSASNGEFELQDLPGGTSFDVQVFDGAQQRYAVEHSLTLAVGEERAWDLAVPTDVGLAVRFVGPQGEPVAKRRVTLRPHADAPADGRSDTCLTTDADGRIFVARLAHGPWSVDVAPTAQSYIPIVDGPQPVFFAPMKLDVPPQPSEQTIELRGQLGQWIQGEVTRLPEAFGWPPRVLVRGMDDNRYWRPHAIRDDGTFSVGPLTHGRYALTAIRDLCTSDTVEAWAGDHGVRIEAPDCILVSASIVDAHDGVRAGGTVRLVLPAGRHSFEGSFGLFSKHMNIGVYSFSATTPDGRAGVLRDVALTDASYQSVAVPVAPGARLTVRYEGPESGVGCEVLLDEVEVAYVWLVAGQARSETVPAGLLEVVLRSRGGDVLARELLELDAAGQHEAVFDLR